MSARLGQLDSEQTSTSALQLTALQQLPYASSHADLERRDIEDAARLGADQDALSAEHTADCT